jgi:Tfp pilus assembly protein PilX
VGGFYPYTNAATATENIPQIANDGWWVTGGNTYNFIGGILVNVANTAQPRFIVQCVEESSSLYRITARGTGGTTDAVVILQSIYKR